MTRVPVLTRGRHPTPAHGWCLLELVSALADEVWSDRPAAVHPVLAAVARCANDESTPAGRRALLRFAVPLLGTADAPAGTGARLAAHCLGVAGRQAWWAAPVWLRRAPALVAGRATRCVAVAAGGRRDEALRALLDDCLVLCGRSKGAGEAPRVLRPPPPVRPQVLPGGRTRTGEHYPSCASGRLGMRER